MNFVAFSGRSNSGKPRMGFHAFFGIAFLAFSTALADQVAKPPLADQLRPVGAGVADNNIQGCTVPTAAGLLGDTNPQQGVPNIFEAPFFGSTCLDSPFRSVVLDLGQIQKIRRMEIRTDKATRAQLETLLSDSPLQVWASDNNVSYREVPCQKLTIAENAAGEQAIRLELQQPECARFVKVRWNRSTGPSLLQNKSIDALVVAFGEGGPAPWESFRMDLPFLQYGDNAVEVSSKQISEVTDLRWEFKLLKPDTCEVVEKLTWRNEPWAPASARSEFREGEWHAMNLEVPETEPGPYDLAITCFGRISNQERLLWEAVTPVRIAAKITRVDLLDGAAWNGPSPGELLLVRPLGKTTVPVALSGNYLFSSGRRGDAAGFCLEVAGKKLPALASSFGSGADIRESVHGWILDARAEAVQLSDASSEWIGILGLTGRQVALAKGEKDLSNGKPFIFVSDGYSMFGNMKGDLVFGEKELKKAAAAPFQKPAVHTTRFDYSPASSSVSFGFTSAILENLGENLPPPRIIDANIAKNLGSIKADSETSPMKTFAGVVHENDALCFAAMRMAATYPAGSHLESWLNSRLWAQNPQWRVRYADGTDASHWSYAVPEVRALYLKYYREVLQQGVDGIHCEFLRHPGFIGFEAAAVDPYRARTGKSPLDPGFDNWADWYAYRAEIITQFMRDLRKVVDEEGARQGRALGITARIPERGYTELGLDPARWAKEGLVDMIAVGSNRLPNLPFNLVPFQAMVAGTKCHLYTSLSPELGDSRDPVPGDEKDPKYRWHSSTSEDFRREFVVNQFRRGAEGAYMFNNQGNDHALYLQLERWDEFENPKRLYNQIVGQ